jgi:hypothetical protein
MARSEDLPGTGSNNAVIFLHNLYSEPVEVRFTLKEDFFDLLSGFILAYIYIATSNTLPCTAQLLCLSFCLTKETAGVPQLGAHLNIGIECIPLRLVAAWIHPAVA